MKSALLLSTFFWASGMAMQQGAIADRQFSAFKQQKERAIQRWRDIELAAWMLITGVGSGIVAARWFQNDQDRRIAIAKASGTGAFGSVMGGMAFLTLRDISSAEELRLTREYAFNKILGSCSQCAHDVLPNMTAREQKMFQARMANKKYASLLCPEHKKRAEALALANQRSAETKKPGVSTPDFGGDLDYTEVVGSGYNN